MAEKMKQTKLKQKKIERQQFLQKSQEGNRSVSADIIKLQLQSIAT